MDYKMVIVARKDVKLGAGKLAAQVGHASVECALRAQKHQPTALKRWLDEGQKKVVVRAPGSDELFRLKDDAERLGLTTALIKDAGHTQLAPGTITVLGIGPGPVDDVDRVTAHLQLY